MILIKKLLSCFQPSEHLPEIEDSEVLQQQYRRWRLRTFYSMYIGYALYYFTRKNLTFITPYLCADLGLSKTNIGWLITILSISYGISKFASGVLSDRANTRYLMAFGLLITGLCSLCFGLSSSLMWLGIFWGINGWFQGWGWPACTKQLTHWFSRKERGKWWGVFSTSHTVGGCLIAYVAGSAAMAYGWRVAMFITGTMGVVAGLWLVNRLRDMPQALGLPGVESYRQRFRGEALEEGEALENTEHLSVKQILMEQVLSNRYIWLLAISYFFVYVVRTAVNDWGPLYLVQVKGYSPVAAGACISFFEVGGFLGMLFAGWGSDYWFGGRRIPFVIFNSVAMIFSILGLWFLGSDQPILMALLVGVIGFLVFGPQMLVGLAAAEWVNKGAASTSNGFVGAFACFGAAAAGYPLGRMTDLWGWYYGFILSLVICSMICVLVLLPLWSVKKGRPPVHEADAGVEGVATSA